MKVTKSIVRKTSATNIKNLDPVHIYLEDFSLGKGKITISCWDKSWHSYWGGMGDRTIDKFFLDCDNHYLAKKLSSIKSSINDYNKLNEKIKELKEGCDDYDTYELFQAMDSMGEEHAEWECWLRNNWDLMSELFGTEWWYYIPKKENPKYIYLCRVIETTKNILRTI